MNPSPTPRKLLALLVCLGMALFVLAGYDAATAGPAADPVADEVARVDLFPTVIMKVFVVWGSSNACGSAHPGTYEQPDSPTPVLGSAYEYFWEGTHPPRLLEDPPTCYDRPGGGPADKGSAWPQFAITYADPTSGLTDHVVFLTSAALGGSTVVDDPGFDHNWDPYIDEIYSDGVIAAGQAMTDAETFFNQDLGDNADTTVVFGGILWNGGNDFYYFENFNPNPNPYPWVPYREALHRLLTAASANVLDVYGGRFYYIGAGYRPEDPYPPPDMLDYYFAYDLESDVCALYPFCSMIQEGLTIKEGQVACYDECIGDGDPPALCVQCDGWYDDDNRHWGQRGQNHIGQTTAQKVYADEDGDPFRWEVGVEVPQLSQRDDPIRLDVYDSDGGAPIETFYIAPTIANPDWTADFDGDDDDADWQDEWGVGDLDTEFLTFEFNVELASDSLLARYVYVPTDAVYAASQTDFFRPDEDTATPAVRFEVAVNTNGSLRVEGGPGPDDGTSLDALGPFFEGSFASSYVLPYNADVYTDDCAPDCPDEPPGFFLARLPADADVPDDTERRLTFAEEADVVIPAAWDDPLVWDVEKLVLAFPEERRLVVEGGLEAMGVTLTAADTGEGWGGVIVYGFAGVLDFDGVTVTAAAVGIEVNSDGNVFTDVFLDGNGVGLLSGFACPVGGCSGAPTRSSFRLEQSCVTNSDFVPSGTQGYGIWALHTDASISESTVAGNEGYGLRIDEADIGARRLLLEENATVSTSSHDGARVSANGELFLTSLNSVPGVGYLGENKLLSNYEDELHVDQDGYAVVGLFTTAPLDNHLTYGGTYTSQHLVDNDDPNTTIHAFNTYWGGGAPPSSAFEGAVNRSNHLANSPSGSAGRTGGCTGVGADLQGGGGASLRGGTVTADATAADAPSGPTLRGTFDPEDEAWLREQLVGLRIALAAAPDSAALVRALYAMQRLDRDDEIGEHEATMAVLDDLRLLLEGGTPLAEAQREASEAALVAHVHDALRHSRYTEAEALLEPFAADTSLLPAIEGSRARRTLALAQVALDEQAGDLATALARLAAVQGELGPEDEQLAQNLEATAALLERLLGGEAQTGREGGTGALVQAVSDLLDLPADYALGAAYPNPFTGRTTVPFALPQAARVEIHVYDLLGRRVAVLAEGLYEAGRHVAVLDSWALASGVYVVRATMRPVYGSAGRENSGSVRAFTERITLVR